MDSDGWLLIKSARTFQDARSPRQRLPGVVLFARRFLLSFRSWNTPLTADACGLLAFAQRMPFVIHRCRPQSKRDGCAIGLPPVSLSPP
jgi:hypothetical protein